MQGGKYALQTTENSYNPNTCVSKYVGIVGVLRIGLAVYSNGISQASRNIMNGHHLTTKCRVGLLQLLGTYIHIHEITKAGT